MIFSWLQHQIVLRIVILGNLHDDLRENTKSLLTRFPVYSKTYEVIGTSGNTAVVPSTVGHHVRCSHLNLTLWEEGMESSHIKQLSETMVSKWR